MQLNIKRLMLITKKQTSQVNDFSPFLCMERCKSLSLLKSFLSHTSSLSRASILSASTLSGCTTDGHCSGWWLCGHDILCLRQWQRHSLSTSATGLLEKYLTTKSRICRLREQLQDFLTKLQSNSRHLCSQAGPDGAVPGQSPAPMSSPSLLFMGKLQSPRPP